MGTRARKERKRETGRKKEFRRTLCRCVGGTREGKKTFFCFVRQGSIRSVEKAMEKKVAMLFRITGLSRSLL